MNVPVVVTPARDSMMTWSKPTEPATPKTLLAIGIAGLAGAIALPETYSGIGYFIVAVVCAGSAWMVMGRLKPLPVMWGVLSLSLVGVTVLRDADWLFMLCIMGACVAASLALTDGRSIAGVLLSSISVGIASLMAIPWVYRGLGALRRRATRQSMRVVQSVLVSVILLLVFVPLLASADAAFAAILDDFWPTVDADAVARWFLLFGLVAFGAAGASLAISAPPHFAESDRDRSRLSRVEWALPVGILVALFTGFAVIQFAVLFGGADYVQRTSGTTFAEYARSGFWQLLAVTLLTLGVVGAAARYAPRETARDRAWLRGLLGALCVLMLVVVASALSRMWTYQQAYGFTVQRLLVEAIELWLGVVYLLVIAAGVRLEAKWLPRAMAGAALGGLLLFAWLNPERLIAQHNVARYQETGKIDTMYLTTLSADAAPELIKLPPDLRECAMLDLGDRLGDKSWQSWNLSRANAKSLVQYTPDRCRPGDRY
ncbi:pimeloyl-ACP methyl ester carboxylesterase [Kibdelosporangium banguiense]|uniref:Pimeloyl-ACP methyl ester carboxylesterase n=1 Tax=Kibdelosporangium banguiense TaxID=1365924 RepID=A0ABS4TK63_9PSEU|nr:DUF4173 domain-containing protein [Kibdelosporangium banguiense]MBP2324756.1 pimeloyl-ACP methyl ester carboxylesterase [Kibdelosporangium banguiense]